MRDKRAGGVFILIAVIAVFITPWGYAHISALALLLPLVIAQVNAKQISGPDFSLLFLFSFSYAIVIYINQGTAPGAGTLLKYLLMPSVFFLAGSILASRSKSSDTLIKRSVLLLVFFSIVVVISITLDVYKTGFVSDSRNVQILGEGEDLKNATGANAFLAPWLPMLGFAFYRARDAMESRFKIILIVLSVFALIYSLRLGSRTGVSTMFIGVLILFVFNLHQYRRAEKFWIIALLTAFLFAGSYALDIEDLTVAFQDRLDSDEFGAASAGGRVELWEYYFDRLLEYPMGNIPAVNSGFTYAHNYFLDVAKISGLVPTILLVLFTIVAVLRLYRLLQGNISPMIKSFVLGLNISFYLVFMVEPILEGGFTLFCLYLFYCGVIKEVSANGSGCKVVRHGS